MTARKDFIADIVAAENTFRGEFSESELSDEDDLGITTFTLKHLETKWGSHFDAIIENITLSGVFSVEFWLDSVLDLFDPTSALPASPNDGDRYISISTANGWTENNIYEYDSVEAVWVETVTVVGVHVYVDSVKSIRSYDGVDWGVGYRLDILNILDSSTEVVLPAGISKLVSDTLYWYTGNFRIKTGDVGPEGDRFSMDSDGSIILHGYAGAAGALQVDTAGAVSVLPSDSSLKERQNYYIRGLKEILKLEPKSWYWKNDKRIKNLDKKKKQAGFIAQDVEKIIPEAVFGEEGGKAIYDKPLIATLVNAIKEQNETINDLMERVRILENA